MKTSTVTRLATVSTRLAQVMVDASALNWERQPGGVDEAMASLEGQGGLSMLKTAPYRTIAESKGVQIDSRCPKDRISSFN